MTSYVPYDFCLSLADIDLTDRSLYEFLESTCGKQSFEFAQLNEFDYIEIHNVWGKNIEDFEKGELKALDQRVKDHGLKVSCISSTIFLRCYLDERLGVPPELRGFATITGDYESHLASLLRAFQAADILGTSLIRTFGFSKVDQLTDSTFTMAAEILIEPIKLAKKAEHTIVMENCPHASFGWGIKAEFLDPQ